MIKVHNPRKDVDEFKNEGHYPEKHHAYSVCHGHNHASQILLQRNQQVNQTCIVLRQQKNEVKNTDLVLRQ